MSGARSRRGRARDGRGPRRTATRPTRIRAAIRVARRAHSRSDHRAAGRATRAARVVDEVQEAALTVTRGGRTRGAPEMGSSKARAMARCPVRAFARRARRGRAVRPIRARAIFGRRAPRGAGGARTCPMGPPGRACGSALGSARGAVGVGAPGLQARLSARGSARQEDGAGAGRRGRNARGIGARSPGRACREGEARERAGLR